MVNTPLKTRLAPTPSGYLHLGNAVNFVLTYALTRVQNGTVSLRIDDLDAPRVRPEYIEDIFRTIKWLGLTIDTGPSGPEEHQTKYSQQLRVEQYLQTIQTLIEKSGNVFACDCSRSQIRRESSNGQYPGTCRKRNLPIEKANTALRIQTPDNQPVSWKDLWLNDPKIDLSICMRDFVIRRKDGIPAYQIASLTDDIEDNINFIVRGEDLKESTAAQLFLAEKLQNQFFPNVRFFHHPLLLEENGRKLSKSNQSAGLKGLHEKRESPRKVFQLAAGLLGICEKNVSTLEDLKEAIIEKRILTGGSQ